MYIYIYIYIYIHVYVYTFIALIFSADNRCQRLVELREGRPSELLEEGDLRRHITL